MLAVVVEVWMYFPIFFLVAGTESSTVSWSSSCSQWEQQLAPYSVCDPRPESQRPGVRKQSRALNLKNSGSITVCEAAFEAALCCLGVASFPSNFLNTFSDRGFYKMQHIVIICVCFAVFARILATHMLCIILWATKSTSSVCILFRLNGALSRSERVMQHRSQQVRWQQIAGNHKLLRVNTGSTEQHNCVMKKYIVAVWRFRVEETTQTLYV